jgi:hypothetical protein
MKVVVLVLFFTASVFTQAQVAPIASACGSDNVSFKVKLDKKDHPPAQPGAGKALVYFIHDSGGAPSLGYPTTRMGVDGAWAGANRSDSYFSVSVEPGEHHVCADLQTSLYEDRTEFAHFRAEAGKVYYYRTRLITSRSVELLELDLLDSDQGSYLISLYPLSVPTAKNGEKRAR